MARRPRLHVPGLPAHLVIRGNDRNAIFRSEGDRIYFHRCLREAAERYGVAIHAYVFMTNHVHLVGTATHASSIPRAFQMLGRRYVSYFNYLHGRTGTLWEGRYHASPIEAERYLFACHRYVEMNPVRAGMVPAPADFAWSSHGRLAFGKGDDLVIPHPIYAGLGPTPQDRCKRYRAMFDSVLEDETLGRIREALKGGLALGSDEFCRSLEEQTGRRVTRARIGRPSRRAIDAGNPKRGGRRIILSRL